MLELTVGKVMFHLSDIKKYLRCKRLFYLENQEERSSRTLMMLRCDEDREKMIKGKLKIDSLFVGKPNDSPELLLNAIKEYKWLYNARFEMNNLRLKLPIMHIKKNKKVDVYFLVLLPNPVASDVLTYTLSIKAINKLGYSVDDVYLLHINPNYVREKNIDYDKLLEISEFFYNNSHKPKEHVFDWIKEKLVDYSGILIDMEMCLLGNEPKPIPANKCFKKPRCSFYSYCYGEFVPRRDNEEDSKALFIREMAEENGGLFVDRLALRHWLNTEFKYPLSFVDFEWDSFSVPPYENMRPLEVIPFQYSLDVMNKKGKIKHYDFLGTKDTRYKFLLKLLWNLPAKGSIVSFNSDGGEKLRLLELKRQFPRYGKRIDKVIERLVDISLPFSTGVIFDTRVKSNFSLKNIINNISDISYQDLKVNDGKQAILKWRIYEKTGDKKIKEELLSYCRQDSIALIKIYNFLLEKVEDKK